MRTTSYVLILGPIAIIATFVASAISISRREAETERRYARWSPTRDADLLVRRDIELEKAKLGRYPDTLSPSILGQAAAHTWYYRSSADGRDYELWVRIPREDSGFDAAVLSPDGVLDPDWPSTRSPAGELWTLVQHAEAAPASRWLAPFNP